MVGLASISSNKKHHGTELQVYVGVKHGNLNILHVYRSSLMCHSGIHFPGMHDAEVISVPKSTSGNY